MGNSQGVWIPKVLLEEAGLGGDVEVRAEAGRVVIEAVRLPRAGWAESAARMRAADDDRLIIPAQSSHFDQKKWNWPRQ